ncbi:MAG: hypothetical protein A3I05_07700 [Deltaproteobacteria bacterium RIFCSPLOWO2_02_FULL_44_10]|nr:MAG: hypothetical protein A3C46_09525 [Deltaproteobacteria bacterium RIFCSPHIGHO2_02_FULL_44_16]OGQ46764.1 MAG: hypothetical protein A3I05_07700 [Deltaproteobacteria bacterium RIFCSPLOWO2_02_FULL_44_10]
MGNPSFQIVGQLRTCKDQNCKESELQSAFPVDVKKVVALMPNSDAALVAATMLQGTQEDEFIDIILRETSLLDSSGRLIRVSIPAPTNNSNEQLSQLRASFFRGEINELSGTNNFALQLLEKIPQAHRSTSHRMSIIAMDDGIPLSIKPLGVSPDEIK